MLPMGMTVSTTIFDLRWKGVRAVQAELRHILALNQLRAKRNPLQSKCAAPNKS